MYFAIGQQVISSCWYRAYQDLYRTWARSHTGSEQGHSPDAPLPTHLIARYGRCYSDPVAALNTARPDNKIHQLSTTASAKDSTTRTYFQLLTETNFSNNRFAINDTRGDYSNVKNTPIKPQIPKIVRLHHHLMDSKKAASWYLVAGTWWKRSWTGSGTLKSGTQIFKWENLVLLL